MASPRDVSPADASVTFDESRLQSRKASFEKSRSSSRSRIESELEGPHGIITRNKSNAAPDEDMPHAMMTLSVASGPPGPPDNQPKWPQEWQAYLTWFGGFLL